MSPVQWETLAETNDLTVVFAIQTLLYLHFEHLEKYTV